MLIRLQTLSVLTLGRALLAAFLLISGIKVISYSYNLVRAPFQIEFREGAILSTTQLLLERRNPFAAESLPQYLNVYGIFYNLAMLPLARLFGDTFLVHRAFTMFCLYAGVAFVIVLLIRRQSLPLFALAGGLCLLANQMYSVTPVTRPDGLGFLLYLLAVFLPWERKWSKASLAISALLSVLAFFTKLYFSLAAVYVAVFLFLNVSKKLALFYGVFFAGLLAAGIFIVLKAYPFYFYNTFFMALYQPVYVLSHMLRQMRQFTFLYAGMLAALAFSINWQTLGDLRLWRPGMINLKKGLGWFDFLNLGVPLCRFKIDYPLMSLVLVVLVTVFKLGGHTGSKMAYLFQLISPLFVIVFVQLISRQKRFELISCLLVGATVAVNLGQIGLSPYSLSLLPGSISNDPAKYDRSWRQMAELLHGDQRVLNSPLIAGYLVEQGKPLVDNGHSEYFRASAIPPSLLLPPASEVYRVDDTFRRQLRKHIQERYFDQVIVDANYAPLVDKNLLKQYYSMGQSIDLYAMQNRQFFHLEVWNRR